MPVYQEAMILFSISLDGNGALFTKVLCDIPVLHITLIRIFGWKHSYCKINLCLYDTVIEFL